MDMKINKNGAIDNSEKLLWDEYLTMPNHRDPSRPEHKTYSQRLIEPGKGKTLEKMWEGSRNLKSISSKKVIEDENIATLGDKAAFINNTIFKSQVARISRHVQLGLNVAELDLEKKRNKLKSLILKEETDLTHEYVDKAQKLAAELDEHKKKKVEEIILRNKKEQEEITKKLREQQRRENSQDYQHYLSKVLKIESAEVQKQQICEKIMKKEREEEYDRFWTDIAKKIDDERQKFDENEATLKLTKIQQQREILNKQMIGKKIMQDEMKKVKEAENLFIDKLKEQMKEEEEIEREFMHQQKLELKKMKLTQLEENQKIKMEKEAREKAFDNYYCKKVAESIQKDKVDLRETKDQLRKEAEYFIQQLKEINAAKLEEEKIIEALRQKEIAKKEAIIQKNIKTMKEAKDKLQLETVETWKQQLIHKKQLLEAEMETEKFTDQWSKIILDKNVDLDLMLNDKKKDKEIKHVKDLEAQVAYERVYNAKINQKYNSNMESGIASGEPKLFDFKPCPVSTHPFTQRTPDK